MRARDGEQLLQYGGQFGTKVRTQFRKNSSIGDNYRVDSTGR